MYLTFELVLITFQLGINEFVEVNIVFIIMYHSIYVDSNPMYV